MERKGNGRQDPFEPPRLSHTAFNSDVTSDDLLSLYISEDRLPLAFPKDQAQERAQNNLALRVRQARTIPDTRQSHSSQQYTSIVESMASKNRNAQQQYQLKSTESPADQAKSLSQNNKDQLISSLRTHKVNTITELRRIEKIFAYLDSEEVTEPMTSAWAHYVNSNNLLSELRGLTQRIPFSSECVDEAKSLVVADPASVRSWNFCWLVLVKIEKDNLILKHARALASKRSTWGDRQPNGDDARKFIMACVAEWTSALRQLLKHWDTAPSTTGD